MCKIIKFVDCLSSMQPKRVIKLEWQSLVTWRRFKNFSTAQNYVAAEAQTYDILEIGSNDFDGIKQIIVEE